MGHILQSHLVAAEIETQRKAGVRGPQMGSGLHLVEYWCIQELMVGQLKELSSKYSIFWGRGWQTWFQRLRQGRNGRGVGGWKKRRPSLYPPITVEARDRPRWPPSGASISLAGFKTYHQNFQVRYQLFVFLSEVFSPVFPFSVSGKLISLSRSSVLDVRQTTNRITWRTC